MTYELTPLLTTIAAASASIVAILGGFIASKLISISGERSAVLDKLKSINEKIAFNQSTIDRLQTENDEDDALNFIRDHIENLFNGNPLDKAFDNGEKQTLPFEKLQPYWNRAEMLREENKKEYTGNPQFNSDGIPVTLATKYSEDEFPYSVLEGLSRYLDKLLSQEKQRRNPLLGNIPSVLASYRYARPALGKYSENEREIEKMANENVYLEFEKAQYELQKQQLKKPDGLKKGLVLFALFSVLCIILPLLLCPFTTESHCVFLLLKLGCIGLFTTGLVSIFCYMYSLLKWEDAEITKTEESIITVEKENEIQK